MYFITGLLGIALGVSPWVFQYSDDTSALWTSLIGGGIVLLVSAYKAIAQDRKDFWEYWVLGLAAIVVMAMPFVLSFTALSEALWTTLVIGGLLLVASGYELFVVQPELASELT